MPNTCSAYLIKAAGLVGLNASCSPTEFDCDTPPCNVGFTWQDISPPGCINGAVIEFSVQVTVGENCNAANYGAPATFNGVATAVDLNTGPIACACGSAGSAQTVSAAAGDIPPYTYSVGGTNTLTFRSANILGFQADSSGAFAQIIVSP